LAAALAAVSVLPDLDVIAFGLQIPYEHALGHRGFSHSLLFAVLLAPLGAAIFRRSAPLVGKPWLILLALFFAACASHGVLDASTDAGLGIGFFVPFSDERFFLPWRPILTSPLGIRAFFDGNGGAILFNEFVWVWVPMLLLVASVKLGATTVRFLRARSDLYAA
jgi:inner membrane protein